MTTALLACAGLVASLFALPPRVLPSILQVEGGRVGMVHHNTDGSDDLGPMQINTIWLPDLARYTGLGIADIRQRLISVPCFNMAAAGAILRHEWDASGDLLVAVGNYHSHTPARHRAYRTQVENTAAALFERVQPPAQRP